MRRSLRLETSRRFIANLIRTLKEQNYPSELLDIYVIADNCTDNTAQISRQAGAYVYERFNKVQVGKGYALEYLFQHIFEEQGRDGLRRRFSCSMRTTS